MPVQPTYPGVYIEEVPSGVRTIAGVPTSIAAFIGYFKRGPMNTPVQIFNFGDFERVFGGLDLQSEASYAIQQFFLNGGGQAHVVRVAGGNPNKACATIPSSDGSIAFEVEAIHEGSWGNNVRLKIDYNTADSDEFNITITEYDKTSNQILRQELFRNLSMKKNSPKRNFVEAVINDTDVGSKIVRVSNVNDGAPKPRINGTISGQHGNIGDKSSEVRVPISAPQVTFEVTIGNITKEAQLDLDDLETVAIGYSLSIVASNLEGAIRSALPANPQFANATVSVFERQLHILAGGNIPESLIFLENETGNNIINELSLNSGTGGHAVSNFQEYELGLEPETGETGETECIGDDGEVPDGLALIGSLNKKTGIYALEDVDLFNILCIPRVSITIGDNPMDDSEADAVLSAAQAYCEIRRAFLIIDTPLGKNDLSSIKDWMAAKGTLRHKNAALYFPRVKIPDPLDDFRLRSVGASGTIAGLYARTDNNRGIWKTPAGTEANLRNVSELSSIISDQENGVLNPLGVNCLRSFPVHGNICWGGRTLVGADQTPSQWKYVAVRRLTLFLEESLYRGTQWVVFEPNDEPLWAQIRLNIGAFMHNLFRQGAFQGKKKEAYFVKCDAETTNQTDIDSGIVNIVVGFAPLKPAEFVIIKIEQISRQIDI